MRLLWAAGLAGIGNVYGYSTYERELKKALIEAGVQIVTKLDDPFDIAVHIITPEKFRPIPRAKNMLCTMFEMASLPEHWIAPLQGADIVVVPCRQNRDLFKQSFKGPVEICRLGIDPEVFTYCERSRPPAGEPFRFLWVGAPNMRKGFDLLPQVWSSWLRSAKMPPNVQLYMKTTNARTNEKVVLYQMAYVKSISGSYRVAFVDSRDLPVGSPGLPNIIIDYRDVPQTELVELYHSAHAFILPSTGEGWGLTLTEAMSTGLPCIWTAWGGPRDFADETIGYPLTKLSFVPAIMQEPTKRPNGEEVLVTTHESLVAMSDVTGTLEMDGVPTVRTGGKEIIRRCEQIHTGYDRALELGTRASERMHRSYTWAVAAEEFIEICGKYL
jgi:glycosyltransferase involved in cell wall biosynthesis